MSGIAGWVNWQNPAIDWKQTIINKMTGSLYRRGPDQLNLWTGPNIALGYAQLAAMERIIGEQPLHYRDQNEQWTIIFDGTLYNCEELISDLQREGVSLVTGAHSEVVLKAYVQWGADCLEKMNGVYSLAIWHDASKTLFLARDRLGVKPLFYTERNGSFLFGSEIKALLSHPEVRAEVDRDGLAEVLGLAPSRTPGHGLFRGLHELRPGYSLTIKQTGIKLNRYWQVRSMPHRDTLTDTIDKVRFLFIDTVKRQLNHIEGSVAAFLSGGVDSSAISAIAVQQRGADLIDTFSIDYAENERYFSRNAFQPDPDAPWVDRMVQFLSTRHRYLLINPEQLVDQLVEAMLVRDQPGMADIDSSLLWACQQIKKRASVVFSGEGADEIFGGYPWFYRSELLHRDAFPWMVSVQEREAVLYPEWKKKLNIGGYIEQRYLETLAEVPRLEGESEEEARRREMFYMNMTWFMTGLLDRKDRMSMGAGLETRLPFADHRLVEYVWNVPWNIKRLNDQEKGLLREALRGILPDEVLFRKKSPYPKTFHPRYTQLVRQRLLKIMEDKQTAMFDVIDPQALRALTDSEQFAERPWHGQLMRGPQVMGFYIQLYEWFKEYDVNIV